MRLQLVKLFLLVGIGWAAATCEGADSFRLCLGFRLGTADPGNLDLLGTLDCSTANLGTLDLLGTLDCITSDRGPSRLRLGFGLPFTSGLRLNLGFGFTCSFGFGLGFTLAIALGLTLALALGIILVLSGLSYFCIILDIFQV